MKLNFAKRQWIVKELLKAITRATDAVGDALV